MTGNIFDHDADEKTDAAIEALEFISGLSLDGRVNALNRIRERLHSISPFKTEPVDFIRWVPSDIVHANDYNPNSVAPPEMELLRTSIMADGYCVEQSTPVLCADLRWRAAGSLKAGQEIVAFDEFPADLEGMRKGSRRYLTATVTHNELLDSELVTVTTEDGQIRCTPNHPWLARCMHGSSQGRIIRWVKAEDLQTNDLVYKLIDPWIEDRSWGAAWLAGFLDGEGTMSVNLMRNGVCAHRLAGYQRPGVTADRMIAEMSARVRTSIFEVDRSNHPDWNNMVMCRVDRMPEIMKLLGTIRPERLIEDGGRFWENRSITAGGNTSRVVSVARTRNGTIASLATSSKTYIAGGFAMHNTQPIVTNEEDGKRVVIDGFHRNRVGKECADVTARIHGYLPVVQIRTSQVDITDRMASTIRHNRARGKHKVEAMSDIVIELKRRNWSDDKIAKNLGMEQDEILRLCQISGLTELFSDTEFSKSWDVDGEVSALDYEELSDDFDTSDVEVRTANTADPDRVFHPYHEWECYKAGFYATGLPGHDKKGCEIMYRDFLASDKLFREALEHVISEWKNSCEHYLTNSAMNRIAWLGQAAACQAMGLPSEYRGGFHMLDGAQQARANETALEYLNKWLTAHDREPVAMEAANPNRQADIY